MTCLHLWNSFFWNDGSLTKRKIIVLLSSSTSVPLKAKVMTGNAFIMSRKFQGNIFSVLTFNISGFYLLIFQAFD